MRGVRLSDLHCSVARTLDVVGERWTLLLLRDAFMGKRRFEEFASSLPIARNVLTDRLQTLVDHGVLRRKVYQDRPRRFEYRLTESGHWWTKHSPWNRLSLPNGSFWRSGTSSSSC